MYARLLALLSEFLSFLNAGRKRLFFEYVYTVFGCRFDYYLPDVVRHSGNHHVEPFSFEHLSKVGITCHPELITMIPNKFRIVVANRYKLSAARRAEARNVITQRLLAKSYHASAQLSSRAVIYKRGGMENRCCFSKWQRWHFTLDLSSTPFQPSADNFNDRSRALGQRLVSIIYDHKPSRFFTDEASKNMLACSEDLDVLIANLVRSFLL